MPRSSVELRVPEKLPTRSLFLSHTTMKASTPPPQLPMEEEEEQWELRHDDDGFTYKISKKARLETTDPSPPPPSSATDPEAEDQRRRRERKRNALFKVKAKYQTEIDQWEILSNSVRATEERARQRVESDVERFGSIGVEENDVVACGDLVVGNLGSGIDELLRQAEAQEAIIHDVSNLCDVAEAMCDRQREWLVQSFIDLPVWSSPKELMASLCDE